jgi:hypothetical protein
VACASAKRRRCVLTRAHATDPSAVRSVVDEPLSILRSSRALLVLDQILPGIPTSQTMIVPLIVASFPHRRLASLALQHYVKNVLHVATTCVAVRPQILVACVNLLVSLDVEVRVDENVEHLLSSSPLDQTTIVNKALTRVIAARDLGIANGAHSNGHAQPNGDDDALQFEFDGAGVLAHQSAGAAAEVDAASQLAREAADKLDSLMHILLSDIKLHCGGDRSHADTHATRSNGASVFAAEFAAVHGSLENDSESDLDGTTVATPESGCVWGCVVLCLVVDRSLQRRQQCVAC